MVNHWQQIIISERWGGGLILVFAVIVFIQGIQSEPCILYFLLICLNDPSRDKERLMPDYTKDRIAGSLKNLINKRKSDYPTTCC